MAAKIILDPLYVKQIMKDYKSTKALAQVLHCGEDFIRKFLLEHDLYEEYCVIHNKPIKMKKEYCVECGSSNQINRIKGVPYCKKHWNHMVRYGKIVDKTIYDKNDYIFEKDIVKIVLRDKYQNVNGYCIIDKEDYEKIKDFKWYLVNQGYCTTKSIQKEHGIRIHSVLMSDNYMELTNNILHDHINQDKLDNRKCNLRTVTQHQNTMNMGKKYNNSSGVTGVQQKINKHSIKWIASIMYEYKGMSLGTYNTFDEAVIARLKGEAQYFKEYAPNYNKDTNTIYLEYVSQDDHKTKIVEISLEGKMLKQELKTAC